jgi:peptidoglycan/LPS O-acetylase OafA/YrhL
MAKERLVFLDILKIISIVLVISFHFLYQLTLDNSLRSVGFVGVSLFFIISGFSLAKNYSHHTNFSFKWFLKRYLKIASAYYVALILIIILFAKQCYSGNLFLNLLAHFTFTDSFFPQFSYGIISPAWFLAPLIVYYFLFPFLNKIIKNNWKLIFIPFIFSVAIRLLYSESYVSTNFLFFLGEFCFGIAFAYSRKIWLMIIPLIIILVQPLMYIPFMIFFLFSFVENKHLSSKTITWISGNIIFLFLFHEALINLIFNKWQIYNLSGSISIIVYITLVASSIYLSNIIQKALINNNKLF